MIFPQPSSPSKHLVTDLFITDVIAYYVRMGAQPVCFQVYAVKVGAPSLVLPYGPARLVPHCWKCSAKPLGSLGSSEPGLCAPPVLQLLAKLPGPVAPLSTAQLGSVILGRLFQYCEGQQSKP